MRWIFLAIMLFVLWLLMSGIYKPLVIGLGAGSAVFSAWIVWRMEQASAAAKLQGHQRPIATIGYFFWLVVEIIKANWAVTKVILAPELARRQHFFQVPISQKSDVAQAIFANSITLTPGTITVEPENEYFWVHALHYSDDDPHALADMDRRVTATEGK